MRAGDCGLYAFKWRAVRRAGGLLAKQILESVALLECLDDDHERSPDLDCELAIIHGSVS